MQFLVNFEIFGTLAFTKITWMDKSGLFYNDRFKGQSCQSAPPSTAGLPDDWPGSLTLIYKSLNGAMISAIFFAIYKKNIKGKFFANICNDFLVSQLSTPFQEPFLQICKHF